MKKYIIILASLCLSCAHEILEPELSKKHRAWKALSDGNIIIEVFSINWPPKVSTYIDEFQRLNPGLFEATSLHDVPSEESGRFIKSSVTERVYKCMFKKGDIILMPDREKIVAKHKASKQSL